MSARNSCACGLHHAQTTELESALLELQPEHFEFHGESFEELEEETARGSADYIRWAQRSLNQILGLRLAVDGVAGPQTRSAIRSFQQRQGLVVDGIVGPKTEAALIAAGAPRPSGASAPTPASP